MCSIRIIPRRAPSLSLSLSQQASILRYFRTIGFIARNVPTDKTTSRFLHGFALALPFPSSFFLFFLVVENIELSDFRNVWKKGRQVKKFGRFLFDESQKSREVIIRDIRPNKLS